MSFEISSMLKNIDINDDEYICLMEFHEKEGVYMLIFKIFLCFYIFPFFNVANPSINRAGK